MRYFGRLPFINIFISNVIFGGVRLRLASLRVKNKLKGIVRPKTVQITDDGAAAEEWLGFKKSGYEKLNIGGGRKNLKGFVNIDFVAHPEVEREIVADALDLSFIPDAAIRQAHSNHFVEHMTDEQFSRQLREYHRILEDGGLLTIRCPNALGVSYGLWFPVVPERGRDEFVALGYPEDDDFFNPLDDWYHKDFHGFLHWIHGDAGNIENQHLNTFTPSKMRAAIESAGFSVLKMTEPETTNLVVVARKN